MKTKELMDRIISDIEKLSDDGTQEITISALLSYLRSMNKYADDKDAYDEIVHQQQLAKLNVDNQHALAMFQSVIDAGKDALRATLIINGGAVIALLSLLGSIGGRDSEVGFSVLELNNAMAVYVLGVLLVAIAYGTRYIAQFKFANEKRKCGYVFKYFSIIFASSTYISFFVASFMTYKAFGGDGEILTAIVNAF